MSQQYPATPSQALRGIYGQREAGNHLVQLKSLDIRIVIDRPSEAPRVQLFARALIGTSASTSAPSAGNLHFATPRVWQTLSRDALEAYRRSNKAVIPDQGWLWRQIPAGQWCTILDQRKRPLVSCILVPDSTGVLQSNADGASRLSLQNRELRGVVTANVTGVLPHGPTMFERPSQPSTSNALALPLRQAALQVPSFRSAAFHQRSEICIGERGSGRRAERPLYIWLTCTYQAGFALECSEHAQYSAPMVTTPEVQRHLANILLQVIAQEQRRSGALGSGELKLWRTVFAGDWEFQSIPGLAPSHAVSYIQVSL